MKRKAYHSDLTDAEWAILAPFIPPALPGGRPRRRRVEELRRHDPRRLAPLLEVDAERERRPLYSMPVRAALAGLPDNAPLNLSLVNAPGGLEVEFHVIVADDGHALIRGEASFPDAAPEDEEE